MIWSGSVASIPAGWQLCDGTSGTPDLRSRFVYGAGSDVNTKAYWASGWEAVAGHWPPRWSGGEEMHLLTVNEMPSHYHLEGAHGPTTIAGNVGNGLVYDSTKKTAKTSDDSWATYHPNTQSTGGSQAHNIMPRFMTLAYIMKL